MIPLSNTQCPFFEETFLDSQPDTSRVWSLLRIMNQFGMKDFCAMLLVLQGTQHLCNDWKNIFGGAAQASDSEMEVVLNALKSLKSEVMVQRGVNQE